LTGHTKQLMKSIAEVSGNIFLVNKLTKFYSKNDFWTDDDLF